MDFALLIPLMALSIPIVAIVSANRRRLEETRLRMGQTADSNVAASLEELKRQIAELRDTTTRYDLSFDSALQRIESRVGNLETRVTTIERTSSEQPVSSSRV